MDSEDDGIWAWKRSETCNREIFFNKHGWGGIEIEIEIVREIYEGVHYIRIIAVHT